MVIQALERVGADKAGLDRIKKHTELIQQLQKLASPLEGVEAKLPAGLDGFGRALVDAPCSSTGTIRRHPDIPWLKREADIAA